jgi:hypothetical protein
MRIFVAYTLLTLLAIFPAGTKPAHAVADDPRKMGQVFLERAKKWIDQAVIYSWTNEQNGYRTDCSGMVSFAWNLPIKSPLAAPDTVALAAAPYAVNIPMASLQPGDIINNGRPGLIGHVVLFAGWIEYGKKFVSYEQNGGWGKAIRSELTLTKLASGETTITEYEDYAPGPYTAQRYSKIPGFVNISEPLQLSTDNPNKNELTTAKFSIRNDGGQIVTVRRLRAGARGPAAILKGWNAPNVDFPVVQGITLKPGESYVYEQSRSFRDTGDYFAEPVKEQNGWGGIPPYSRINFNVSSG